MKKKFGHKTKIMHTKSTFFLADPVSFCADTDGQVEKADTQPSSDADMDSGSDVDMAVYNRGTGHTLFSSLLQCRTETKHSLLA